MGLESVPEFARTYNDELIGFKGDEIHIYDILVGFNYPEVMRPDEHWDGGGE